MNNNYTNEEIYNYITFLDLCCANINEYKMIAKYITTENYEYFIPLFENINIKDNFLTLNNNITKLYSFFEDWIINIFNINDNIDLSSYLIYERNYKYYNIKGKIIITYKNKKLDEFVDEFLLISDIFPLFYTFSSGFELKNNGRLIDIVKHINENYDITENYNDLLYVSSYSGYLDIIIYLIDCGAIINDNNINKLLENACNGKLNIVKYLVNILIETNNLNICEYLNNALLHNILYINYNKKIGNNNNNDIGKYLIDNGANIYDNNNIILIECISDNNFELVEYFKKTSFSRNCCAILQKSKI